MKNNRIKFFSVSFFSIVLGLGGFTISTQKIEEILKLNNYFSNILLAISSLIFIIIFVIYIIKLINFKSEVLKELNHLTKLNFFATISISLLILSIAFLKIDLTISKYLWISGAFLQIILLIRTVNFWIYNPLINIQKINPTWFMPAVGNLIVPIAGVIHFNLYLSWFYFSVGILFGIVLFTILIYRLIFKEFLEEHLYPTLFILVAPFFIGFISYIKLTNSLSDFAKVLYFFGLFLVILLMSKLKLYFKIKFYLSWWAFVFPISAFVIATILFYLQSTLEIFKFIGISSYIFLILLILLVISKTILAVFNKQLCVEE